MGRHRDQKAASSRRTPNAFLQLRIPHPLEDEAGEIPESVVFIGILCRFRAKPQSGAERRSPKPLTRLGKKELQVLPSLALRRDVYRHENNMGAISWTSFILIGSIYPGQALGVFRYRSQFPVQVPGSDTPAVSFLLCCRTKKYYASAPPHGPYGSFVNSVGQVPGVGGYPGGRGQATKTRSQFYRTWFRLTEKATRSSARCRFRRRRGNRRPRRPVCRSRSER